MTFEKSSFFLYDFFPGHNCKCGVDLGGECFCGADWTPKAQKRVETWLTMSDDEMRLRCGEMGAQEIRSVRAVLKNILETL